jgi:hypothetical protein
MTSAGFAPLVSAFEETAAPQGSHKTAPRIIMATLFLSAMIVGWLVLPGDDERIAAMQRDGRTALALQLLEQRFTDGDRRQRTLFQLLQLHEHYGNREKSREILELLAAQRPRDAFVQRQLGQLYKQTQDEPAYMRLLARQLSTRYSEPACRELIGLLRRNGRYDDEQATIMSCRAAGYRRAEDLVRLAYLQAADGKLTDTAALLQAVDDRRWLKESRERLMLFASLIEIKQESEALRRGVRWLKGQPDPDLALDMIYKMAEAGRNDLALQLAREIGTPGDPVSLAVAEIMIDQVQYSAARAFLSGWLEQAKVMDSETATRFVTAAIDAEDPSLALKGAERHGLERFEQKELAGLAEVLIGRSMTSEFDRVRRLIDPAVLQQNPMLWAAVELRLGRMESARAILASVRVEDLDERRLTYLARITDLAGRPQNMPAFLRPRQGAQPAGVSAAIPPLSARPRIVGPAQARVRQRLQTRNERRLGKQPRRPSPVVQVPPPNTPVVIQPFQFPQQ